MESVDLPLRVRAARAPHAMRSSSAAFEEVIMPSMAAQGPMSKVKPVSASNRGKPPTPDGSFEDLAEAVVAGYPGAFSQTCGQIEQAIRSCLRWES